MANFWKEKAWLNHYNGTRNCNHLIRKRILNHLTKLVCEYLTVQCIWLYALIISSTHFRVDLHSIIALMSRNSLLEAGTILESRWSHLNFIHGTCIMQGALWHSGNYRVLIHSKTCMWHDKNMQSKLDLFVWFKNNRHVQKACRNKETSGVKCFLNVCSF